MLQLDLSGSRLINSNLKLLGKQMNRRLGIKFNGRYKPAQDRVFHIFHRRINMARR